MKWSILTIALLVSACATTDTKPTVGGDVDVDERLPGPERFGIHGTSVEDDLEDRFAAFMSEPILLKRRLPADGLRIVLARQLRLYQDISGRYEEAIRAVDNRYDAAWPIFRRAQLFVRLGCSIVATPPPNRLAEDQIEVYRGILRDQAIAPIQQGVAGLESFPSEHPLANDAARLSKLPTGKSVEELDDYCSTTAEYWRHPQPLSVDVVESVRCEDGDPVACYVWSELGSGGAAAQKRACELGVVLACEETR